MSSYLSPVIQHNDQIIFVKGSIKEKEIDFLLDTGAEITVIPTKLAQGLNIPYKKTKLCLTGVIGEDSVLYETPPIEVQFGPKTLTTKLLCAPLNTGAILGMDLLQWWSVTKYNYFVTVLKYIFQVSVLYWSSFILSNFYFYFTTFQSIRSYFLLHYIS